MDPRWTYFRSNADGSSGPAQPSFRAGQRVPPERHRAFSSRARPIINGYKSFGKPNSGPAQLECDSRTAVRRFLELVDGPFLEHEVEVWGETPLFSGRAGLRQERSAPASAPRYPGFQKPPHETHVNYETTRLPG